MYLCDYLIGDSGGPLMLADAPKDRIAAGKAKKDMIIGITSCGYADDKSQECSGFEPGIYTRIDHFLDWIEDTTSSDRREKVCSEANTSIAAVYGVHAASKPRTK